MNANSPDRMHRTDRLNYIVSRMRVEHDVTPTVLAKELNLSERTIYRDLHSLERGNALKKRYSRREGRYLLENELTLPPVKLTSSEALALHHATCSPVMAKDNYFAADLRSGLEKIGAALAPSMRGLEAGMSDTETAEASTASAPRPLDAMQRPLLEALRRAISTHSKIRFLYWSPAGGGEREMVAAPYCVRETEEGWFLLANVDGDSSARPYKLRRIRGVEALDEKFRFPRRFEAETAFLAAWNTHGCEDNDIRVTLRFAPAVAEFVNQYARHPFMEVKPLDDGSVLCTACVPGIREIAWWVLAHGSDVEVVGPPEVRAELAQMTAAAAAVYAKPAADTVSVPATPLPGLEPPLLEMPTEILVSSFLLPEAVIEETVVTSGVALIAPSTIPAFE